MSRAVLITGVTGYMGRELAQSLLNRGLRVRGLVRPGSESKCPRGVEIVTGSPLRAADVGRAVEGCDTLVHLVGTSHPAPWKQKQFESVDRPSLIASVDAASQAGSVHLVYVSVAQPAPVMRGYIAVRSACEKRIRESGLDATILRPWYVLGPGHRWPYLLLPAYRIAEHVPAIREGALRLGLLKLDEMVLALEAAVFNRSSGVRVWEVPEIRTIGSEHAWRQRSPDATGGASAVRATGPE